MVRERGSRIEVVCFLDDDTVLEVDYFEQILKTKYIQMQLGVEDILTMRQNLLETAIMFLQRSIVLTVGSVKRVCVLYLKN
jgi:hypothetical protein